MIKEGYRYDNKFDLDNPGPCFKSMGHFLIQGKIIFKSENRNDLIDLKKNYKGAWLHVEEYSFNFKYDMMLKNLSKKLRLNTIISFDHLQDGIYNNKPPPYKTFIHLNRWGKLKLSWSFNNTFIQKKDFWMWLINILVAMLAIFVSYLAIKYEFFN